MSHYFSLTSITPVYLYGAASIGKIVYEKNPDIRIQGFIDARAKEIEKFMGLPVYTLSEAQKYISADAVIMISVKNVFELEGIALTLYEAGFSRLIYKSRAVLEGMGNEDDLRLSEIWDSLVSGTYRGREERLVCFQNNIQYSFTDQTVISKNEEEVLAYIPVELIYTNDRNDKWSDINIQGYYPHIYFFYFLSNHRNGQAADYLKFVEDTALMQGDIKITEAWRKNVLRNRTMVYENMRLSLDMDPQFFYRNAPTAIWNEKGYFNLTSGKHRCAFLVSQGYRYIALRVREEEYEKFLGYEDAEKIREKILKEKIRYLNTKIYHPWFYRYPGCESKFYSLFQIEILCRVIRMAIEKDRAIKLYTNLSNSNSLFRILNRCRFVQIAGNADIENTDILLLDEVNSLGKSVDRACSENITRWYISTRVSGEIIAEYFVEENVVYFCEQI